MRRCPVADDMSDDRWYVVQTRWSHKSKWRTRWWTIGRTEEEAIESLAMYPVIAKLGCARVVRCHAGEP